MAESKTNEVGVVADTGITDLGDGDSKKVEEISIQLSSLMDVDDTPYLDATDGVASSEAESIGESETPVIGAIKENLSDTTRANTDRQKLESNTENAKSDAIDDENTENNDRTDGIVVLEEHESDDDDDCNNKNKDSSTVIANVDSAASSTASTKTPEESPPNDLEDDDVILINPFFGKGNPKNAACVETKENIPVFDIESSSDENENGEGDFSADIDFNQPGDWANMSSASQLLGQPCTCNCYHEKGILVNEIERLRKSIFELCERHTVMEDFLEVEFGDKYEKFLKNREHLVSMGFGGKDAEDSQVESQPIDGKRSAKASELVELLKMINDQATSNDTDSKPNDIPLQKSPDKTSQKANSQQHKGHKIPSVTPSTGRHNSAPGRGGVRSYQQQYSGLTSMRMPQAPPSLFQYQPNLMGPPQVQPIPIMNLQSRSYMRMPTYQGSGGHYRDNISIVGRTELYPSGFAGNSYRSGSRYSASSSSQRSSGSAEEIKQSKKRPKRTHPVDGGASVAASSSNDTKSIPSTSKPKEPNHNTPMLLSNKRICPLCSGIIGKKNLRDHLLVHLGHQILCPVCKEEFYRWRTLKFHLRDDHQLSKDEFSNYFSKVYENVNAKSGPELDSLLKSAATPTEKQMVEHDEAIKVATTTHVVTVQAKQSPRPRPSKSDTAEVTKSAPPRRQANSTSARGRPQQRGQAYQARSDNSELYGPGGYAEYASRFLQIRGSRNYTPF